MIEPLRIKLVRIQAKTCRQQLNSIRMLSKLSDKTCSTACTLDHVHLLGIVFAKNHFYLKLAHRGVPPKGLNWVEHLF